MKKEFEIYVPLFYNDGSPIETTKIDHIGETLLQHFDGLNFSPHPLIGFCKKDGVVHRDKIVIYRVVTDKVRQARRWIRIFKEELKKYLK